MNATKPPALVTKRLIRAKPNENSSSARAAMRYIAGAPGPAKMNTTGPAPSVAASGAAAATTKKTIPAVPMEPARSLDAVSAVPPACTRVD